MTSPGAPRLRFPRILQVRLNSFSLYTQQRDIVVSAPHGVLCLAGANGIGKSTFLAAVNYGLTGRVPGSGRGYDSAGEYYAETAEFPKAFFDGRIDETDRDTAVVYLDLQVGDCLFSLSRGLFTPNGLRTLQASRLIGKSKKVEYDDERATDDERQHEYATRLTAAMGLKSFEQFVFLQHFVLTFDESRRLLFWDEKALEAALFIAFGTDPDQHSSADYYRREMEKSESLGRNLKWQSLQFQKRANALLDSMGSATPEGAMQLEATYDKLESSRVSTEKALEDADSAVSDADLLLANASAEVLTLKQEYSRTFARHVGDSTGAGQHPIVVEATTEKRCAVCGSSGNHVAEQVRGLIDSRTCPLCKSPLRTTEGNAETLELLRKLDSQIANARKRMESASAKRTRVIGDREEAKRKAENSAASLKEFEEQHTEFARRMAARNAAGSAEIAEEVQRLQEESKSLLRKSREHYSTRDRHKQDLQKLQRTLEAHYKGAEEVFVPIFRGLAERFLGIDLDVAVELRQTGLALVLELRSSRRRGQHQLSESQRFFLDIALRMALAQFISDPKSRAPMLVDTPEGSLDIAYEARAGEMFAKFVISGHDLIMTANINTSQLLRKLASSCGSKRMKLVRMTEWAQLSDVQQEEEELFRDAYAAIKKELASGDR